jgi:hypothetical protein
LLRNGGSSARAFAFHIFLGCDFNLVPVEAMVLVEARILGGDYSVLEVGRDLAERNEGVAFAIRLVVYPGLHAPLDVYRSGWRIDPPRGHKRQRGKQPKKRCGDDKPSKNG